MKESQISGLREDFHGLNSLLFNAFNPRPESEICTYSRYHHFQDIFIRLFPYFSVIFTPDLLRDNFERYSATVARPLPLRGNEMEEQAWPAGAPISGAQRSMEALARSVRVDLTKLLIMASRAPEPYSSQGSPPWRSIPGLSGGGPRVAV